MKLFFAMIFLSSSFSTFAFDLTPSCKTELLKQLKSRTMSVSAQVNTETYGNLAPFVGAVCKNDNTFKIKTINQNTLQVTAIVNPWAGYDAKGLRVNCEKEALNKYPVNVIKVEKTYYNSCKLTLTKIKFDFNLDD